MNTTLLLFLLTVCAVLSILIIIFIGKQVNRLIRARTQETGSPLLLLHARNSESTLDSDSINLPPQTAAEASPTIPSRHGRTFFDYGRMQPLACPARVLYAAQRREEPTLVFAPPDDYTFMINR